IRPHITEKSTDLSHGIDMRVPDEQLVRKYTFQVAPDANKIEIKQAIESLYNSGKRKKEELVTVAKVHTVNVKGKTRRVNYRNKGRKSDWKKAVITLGPGQVLEDYGV